MYKLAIQFHMKSVIPATFISYDPIPIHYNVMSNDAELATILPNWVLVVSMLNKTTITNTQMT